MSDAERAVEFERRRAKTVALLARAARRREGPDLRLADSLDAEFGLGPRPCRFGPALRLVERD